ncbi:MAG: 4Fe-4S binding protein [Myxococcales bacterium]|nr:4Fe-4S binding protein [Myxococcales bacterium]MCB9524239.1 4Fe-4S binding protein [Myxococcales bacterium]
MGVSLTYEQCVRTRSRLLDCTACVESCPTDAIALDERGAITVAQGACIGCGLCSAVCPTEAIAAPFDVDAVLAAQGPWRCEHGGLPCVAGLASEVLVTLGLRHDAPVLQAVPGCKAAAGHAGLAERVADANRMLTALGRSSITVEVLPEVPSEPGPEATSEPVSSRRQFFRRMVGADTPPAGAGETLRWGGKIDRARMQRTPPRRARLQTAVAGLTAVTPLAGDLAFTSDKRLDPQACTVCTICVNICPTGALQAGTGWRSIAFDASQCVKCRLCHAVCAPDALTLAEQPALADVLAPGHRLLAQLTTRTCVECGRRFPRDEGRGGLCPPCAAMEDEAFDLTGLR